MGEAREAASACHAAARNAAGVAAAAAARAAGHAVATAHMADHELGAAGYAIKSVKLAAGALESETAAMREHQWQREQLPDAIRELVLSDQENRKVKFTSIYAGF